MLAKDCMSRNVVTATPDMTLVEAAMMLTEKGISGMPVVDGSGRPLGVVSQTDLVRRDREASQEVVLHEFYRDDEPRFSKKGFAVREPDMTRVSEVMTPMVISAEEDTPFHELALMMLRRKIHRIVITRHGHIRGIVTSMDLLRAMLPERSGRPLRAAALLGLFVAGAGRLFAADQSSSGGKPFPNDLGSKDIDVSSYSPELQESYKVFRTKCSACHTLARPINAQYVELSAEEQAKAKKENPDIFKDSKVLQPGDDVWKRMVKRMIAKPGSNIGSDGKRIWELLVQDSKQRKLGVNALGWQAHRKSLLEEFKKKYNDIYQELFGEEMPSGAEKSKEKSK